MYFVSNEDAFAKKSTAVPKSRTSANAANVPKPIVASKPKSRPSVVDDTDRRPAAVSHANNNVEKRVYGRARANLRFSSFYIFCEDFRMQLDYLYSHESETYRKNMLNYMWKHLNARDKHKYYETATKARAMYNLPEHPYTSGV